MKKIYKNRIVNIDKNLFDSKFLFDVLENISIQNNNIEIFFMSELLEKKKNHEILERTKEKPWMWSNVYSPKDELEIFMKLYDYAINNNKKIHIIWITLREEVDILEEYYGKLWFLREDINCFDVNFSVPLISASVNIENIIWKWSDYKSMWKKIFFVPPVRESGQVKAMFKWINRGSVSWIYVKNYDKNIINFLTNQIKEEHILPITLAKTLKYNFDDIWIVWENREIEIEY